MVILNWNRYASGWTSMVSSGLLPAAVEPVEEYSVELYRYAS